jgi:hypothetical protein
MAVKRLTDSTLFQAIARLGVHLPTGDDYLLIVLKGDLLLEEQLHRIVRGALEAPHEIGLRPPFSRVHALARALRVSHARPEVWDAVRRIHEFRNTYAHQLEHILPDAVIDAWTLSAARAYRSVDLFLSAGGKTPGEMTGSDRLRSVIALTYIGLRAVDNPDLRDTGPGSRTKPRQG